MMNRFINKHTHTAEHQQGHISSQEREKRGEERGEQRENRAEQRQVREERESPAPQASSTGRPARKDRKG
jgi:hypothetical protein